jgi:hypothetical protein
MRGHTDRVVSGMLAPRSSCATTGTPMGLVQRDRARLWHPYAPASPVLPLWEVEAADGVRLRYALPHIRDCAC